jgi:hypothetical protein
MNEMFLVKINETSSNQVDIGFLKLTVDSFLINLVKSRKSSFEKIDINDQFVCLNTQDSIGEIVSVLPSIELDEYNITSINEEINNSLFKSEYDLYDQEVLYTKDSIVIKFICTFSGYTYVVDSIPYSLILGS